MPEGRVPARALDGGWADILVVPGPSDRLRLTCSELRRWWVQRRARLPTSRQSDPTGGRKVGMLDALSMALALG